MSAADFTGAFAAKGTAALGQYRMNLAVGNNNPSLLSRFTPVPTLDTDLVDYTAR